MLKYINSVCPHNYNYGDGVYVNYVCLHDHLECPLLAECALAIYYYALRPTAVFSTSISIIM